jgi:hypothetical protein
MRLKRYRNHSTALTWLRLALLALAIAGCKGDGVNSTTSPSTGTLASGAISSTSPPNGAAGVGTNATVTASFSGAMTPSSITNASFFVTTGNIHIIGTVNFDAVNNIATFAPGAALAANTEYTATLGTGVENAAGNALAADYVWTFTTGATPDTVQPLVSAVAPANGAANVALNTGIAVAFSKAMNAASFTATSFTVTAPGPVTIAGAVSYSGYTAVFTPAASLPANTLLTATIANTVEDLEGNTLSGSAFVWSFTTGAATDTDAPAVSSTGIANAATGVPVNLKIAAFFSEAMTPTTINAASFTLTQGTTPVAGTVTYVGGAATFNPSAALAANTAYTAAISTAAKDLAGNAIASAYAWSFTTGAGPLSASPTVSQTAPPGAAVNIALNGQIAVIFSETMDPATVNAANFTLQIPGVSNVAGTVSDTGATAIFTPAANLLPDTLYTATLSTGITNLAGTGLASNYVWSFYPGAIAYSTAPTVSLSIPANQAPGVPINSKIAVAFNQAMNAASITNANLTLAGPGAAAVAGQVSVTGNVATFAPATSLLPNTAYLATVAAGAANLAGNATPANYQFGFTTGATASATAPAVNSTIPVTGATGVFINQAIDISFSEPMDPATISASTISLTAPGSTPVAGTVIYYPASNIASFVPSSILLSATAYTATVSTGIRDLQGNALAAGSTWSFTTGVATGGLPPVNLGSLASFAVVAGTGLNNANAGGQTTINGNVGLSPTATCLGDGAACSATDPVINGTLYANDANGVAATAESDLAAAYADATSRLTGATAGDLTGKVLTSGVYASTSAMSIAPGGTLTLDAKGDPNAVWIFKVGSTLTINNNAQVTLVNGARAANVFWAVAASTTIGTGAGFQGTVLSGTSNSVGAGSTIVGRLLCTSGAAALRNAAISLPGP